MKKFTVLAVVALVGAMVWTGASFVIGKQTEDIYREMVAELELLPGQDGVRYEIVDYERSLFSSTLRTCLVVDDTVPVLAQFSDHLCENSVVRHGPLIWTPDGPFLGLAYSSGGWDYSHLPDPFGEFVDEVFAGETPLQSEMRVGFGGSARGQSWVPGFELETPGLHLGVEEFRVSVETNDVRAHPMKASLRLQDFFMEDPTGHVKVDSVDGVMNLTELLEDLFPVFDLDLNITGVNFIQYAMADQGVRFDLSLQSATTLNGDTLGGHFGVELNDLTAPALGLPADGGSMRWEVNGLDKAATFEVLRIYEEFNRLESAMMVDMMRMFGGESVEPEVDMEAMSEQLALKGEELARVMAENWLRPNETFATASVLLERDDEQQLTLDGRLDYRGVGGSNPSMESWMTLDEQELSNVANADLKLRASESLILPPAMETVQALVQEGLLMLGEGFYRADASFRDGELTINGKPVDWQEYLALLEAMAQEENHFDDPDAMF